MRENILDAISKIEEALSSIEKEYDICNTKLSTLDQIKVDIEHEIELDKLSGSDMMKKYKELQSVLKLRRKYKDSLEYLLSIRSCVNLTHCKTAKNKVKEADKKLSNRKYTHRVKSELRQEIVSEINSMEE